MAAGSKSAKFTLTGVAQSIDTLIGDVSTYSHISLRRVDGAALMGAAGLTVNNGFSLGQGELVQLQNGAIVGSTVFLLGPGIVEFFGHATA